VANQRRYNCGIPTQCLAGSACRFPTDVERTDMTPYPPPYQGQVFVPGVAPQPPAVGGATVRSDGAVVLAHVAWEAVLLAVAVVVTVVLLVTTSALKSFHGFSYHIVILGLSASAFALSLRTRTPNLAVTGIAALAGVVYARILLHGWPPLAAGIVAVGCVALGGVVIGVVAALTRAPGWVASLAGLGACAVVLQVLTDDRLLVLPDELYDPGSPVGWMVLFVVGSLACAGLFLIPGISAVTDSAAGTRRRLVAAMVGLGGSSALAGLAGIETARYVAAVGPDLSLETLVLLLGIVLLGGVSVTSGRGGIGGIVVATWLLTAVSLALAAAGAPRWSTTASGAVAILVGAAVDLAFTRYAAGSPARQRARVVAGPPAWGPVMGGGILTTPAPTPAPLGEPRPGDTPQVMNQPAEAGGSPRQPHRPDGAPVES
jgi:ribose transport system permease protein